MEYLQRLRDKVLEKEAILLEGAEEFQIVGSKCKDIAARDEEGQWPAKKARGKQLGKYHGSTTVKMGVLTSVRGMWVLGRIAWCTPQDKYFFILIIIIF